MESLPLLECSDLEPLPLLECCNLELLLVSGCRLAWGFRLFSSFAAELEQKRIFYIDVGVDCVPLSLEFLDITDYFGPSGVRALPLAAGIKKGGHYFRYFGPSGVRALTLAAGINEGGHYFRYFWSERSACTSLGCWHKRRGLTKCASTWPALLPQSLPTASFASKASQLFIWPRAPAQYAHLSHPMPLFQSINILCNRCLRSLLLHDISPISIANKSTEAFK
jgi:hypothetical protein